MDELHYTLSLLMCKSYIEGNVGDNLNELGLLTSVDDQRGWWFCCEHVGVVWLRLWDLWYPHLCFWD